MFLKLTASHRDANGQAPAAFLISIADITQIRPNHEGGSRVWLRDQNPMYVAETPQEISEILETHSLVISAPKEA